MSDTLQKKLICVFGLGQSGLSAARYLQRTGQAFFVVDSRESPPEKNAISELDYCQKTIFGSVPQSELNHAELIILSPGVSPDINEIQTAKSAGVEVIGDIELFSRMTRKKIVAITGSNGKSTVTDLAHQLVCAAGINAKIGGNFGIPALDYLPEDEADIYILELSSFQLDTTRSLKPVVAVILNISEDHMDRYQCFEDYRRSKLTIANQAEHIIVNADDPLTHIEEPGAHCKSINQFSLKDNTSRYHLTNHQDELWLVSNSRNICQVSGLKMSGLHNWSNALAALAILDQLEIDINQSVLTALTQYTGLSHRFQLISKRFNIDWINDSKATNVGATLAALNSIDKKYYFPAVLIAGGDSKESDLTSLRTALDSKIDHLILIGKDANKFAKLINAERYSMVHDMSEAVRVAKSTIKSILKSSLPEKKSTGLVLLSPACASLDMYKNFEARGQAFSDAVAMLEKECA